MATPGTFRFPEVNATPSAPPAGYALLYIKTDNILYLQDSSGVEIALGSSSSITELIGDVTAVGPGIATATVATVGGKTASEIATSVDDTQDATSLNVPNTIVKRDGSGDIFASNLSGSSSGTNTGDVTVSDTNSIDLTLVGQLLSAALNISADAATAGFLKAITTVHTDGLHVETAYGTPVQIGTSNFIGAASSFALSDHVHSHGNQTNAALHAVATGAANGFMSSTDKTKLDASTSLNTPSTLVMRDASGDFSAGIITATLNGDATGFTGSLTGDVTGTQSATVVSTVGGKTAAQVSTSVDDTLAATNLSTASTIVKRDINGATHLKDLQLDGATSGTLSVLPAAITTSHSLTMPATQGTSGSFLSNDGSGNLSWSNPVTNIDGGISNSVYTAGQFINGGTA